MVSTLQATIYLATPIKRIHWTLLRTVLNLKMSIKLEHVHGIEEVYTVYAFKIILYISGKPLRFPATLVSLYIQCIWILFCVNNTFVIGDQYRMWSHDDLRRQYRHQITWYKHDKSIRNSKQRVAIIRTRTANSASALLRCPRVD